MPRKAPTETGGLNQSGFAGTQPAATGILFPPCAAIWKPPIARPASPPRLCDIGPVEFVCQWLRSAACNEINRPFALGAPLYGLIGKRSRRIRRLMAGVSALKKLTMSTGSPERHFAFSGGKIWSLGFIASDLVESQVAVIFPVPSRAAKGATSKILSLSYLRTAAIP